MNKNNKRHVAQKVVMHSRPCSEVGNGSYGCHKALLPSTVNNRH